MRYSSTQSPIVPTVRIKSNSASTSHTKCFGRCSVLTRLDLDHFKCFELLKLPLGRLTLLSGANASGKSSALQALVLLHQTMRENGWSTRLLLNGSEIPLGAVTDIVDKVTGRRNFGIGLVDGNHSVQWAFEGEDRLAMSAAVSGVQIGSLKYSSSQGLHHLLP